MHIYLFVQGHQTLPTFLFSTGCFQRPFQSHLGLLARLLRHPIYELLVIIQFLVRVLMMAIHRTSAVMLDLALRSVAGATPKLTGNIDLNVSLRAASLIISSDKTAIDRLTHVGHAIGTTREPLLFI